MTKPEREIKALKESLMCITKQYNDLRETVRECGFKVESNEKQSAKSFMEENGATIPDNWKSLGRFLNSETKNHVAEYRARILNGTVNQIGTQAQGQSAILRKG